MSDISPSPVPIAPASSRWKMLDVLLLGSVLIFALVWCVKHYDAELSLDELWHLGTTPGHGNALGTFPNDVLLDGLPSKTSLEGAAPIWAVWTGMDGGRHPPLYCLSLRVWREIVGQSDFAAHFYSTFWSMIAIGFLFACARLAMDRWAALLVCLATAVSQAQMYFAQEVRSYQMLIGLATITLWIMTRIELLGSTRRRAIALAAMSFPLLLTHYFAAGAALAIGVYGLLRLKGHRVAFCVTCVVAGAIYAGAWLPFAVQQLDDLYTGDEFLKDAKITLASTIARLLCAPWRTLNDVGYTEDRTTLFAAILLIAPLFLIRRFKALLPWVLWLGCVLIAVAALDLWRGTKHLTFVRYYASASPAVPLIAVGIAWAIERKLTYWVGSALIVLVAISGRVEERMSVDSPYQADARNYVRDRIAPGEALLIYHGLMIEAYNDQVSLACSHSPQFQHTPTVLMTRPLSPQLLAALPKRAWVMMGGVNLSRRDMLSQFIVLEEGIVKDQAYILHVELRKDGSTTLPTTQPSEGTTQP